jgi:hypothetical protein
MILYTEKELMKAYLAFVDKFMIAKKTEMIPSLEQFRDIYEAEWELYYGDEELH